VLSYDGQPTPRTLRIDIQHGHAGIMQVATDVLSLTKLNSNMWRVGDGAGHGAVFGRGRRHSHARLAHSF
jgi:hypothetical protein